MPSEPPRLRARRCGPDDVIGLRQVVLRPHMSIDEARYPADFSPGTVHFCTEDDAGRVVSVATLLKEPPPWQPDLINGWHLRGMATDPGWRGLGGGSTVLSAVFTYVSGTGGGVLWCNARLGAVGFYERAGMVATGEPWEEPVIGPHIAMFIFIPSGGAPSVAAGE